MNILVVDDHKIFLDSITMLLRNQIPDSNISIASEGWQAIEMIDEVKPHVMLLDINMPGMNGLQVAEYITTKHSDVKIVVLTNVNGEAMVLNLLKLVHGFLFKDIDGEELKACIDTVLRGENYFCEGARKMILNNVSALDKLPKIHLSKRELTVVEMLAEGKTSKEIAVALGLKEKTIHSYREDILKKTKTKNTSELIAFAFQNCLI
jgi:DNA-binding NarL/FixJ family response regulator